MLTSSRFGNMKHIIIGTAGHIDHGKTALVKALTGTDTDRLKEEQQRGITIDIGFAFLSLSSEVDAAIIDVPGHEKFVKNMLAGVSGIDLAILVIAADEGIMPQTEEHLAICDLLQIPRGVVALTKTDLVDAEWVDMVTEDVREGLKGTFLQDAPILPVSSKTGEGLVALRQTLADIAAQVQERGADGVLRLPIDRVFTIKGFGTVVTGTLISGVVEQEQAVEILPERIAARVRNIQVHDAPVERAYAGQRAALNLHGVEKRAIERGNVLSVPELLTPTYMLNAVLKLTPHAERPLKYRSRVRLHHGTSEILARVMFFDREDLLPGESAYVQFRCETPIIALARDRYIIRNYSPVITIGGGEILYLHPGKHKRSSAPVARMERLHTGTVADVLAYYVEDAELTPISAGRIAGMIAMPPARIQEEMERLRQQGIVIAVPGQADEVIHANHYQKVRQQLVRHVEEFHAQFPLKSGITKEELRKKLPAALPQSMFQRLLEELSAEGTIDIEQNLIRRQTHRIRLTPRQEEIKAKIERMYQNARFQPPNKKEAFQKIGAPEKEGEAMFSLLLSEKVLLRVEDDVYYHHKVFAEMTAKIIEHLKQHQEISIGDVKNLFDISRKYSVPVMAYLDAEQITLRKGDIRVLRITS